MAKPFFRTNAFDSQRSSGYKNTAHALAELIDNSFDAEATEVNIYLLEKKDAGRNKISEIVISDNGKGMTKDILEDALAFGGGENFNEEEVLKSNKKGRFGYGLPNASLSQCKSTHIYTWKDKESILYNYLDIDEQKSTGSIFMPEVKEKELPKDYHGIIENLPDTGTIIVWKECDLLSYVKGTTLIDNSSKLLGRLYRYLIKDGKKISFTICTYQDSAKSYKVDRSTVYIKPNDPLFLMEDTVIADALYKESNTPGPSASYYANFSVSKDKCKPTNNKLEDLSHVFEFNWRGRVYKYEMIVSTADKDIQKPGIRNGGSTLVGKFYQKKEDDGNISFVRADREISTGHYGGFYNRTTVNARFWSAEIKFSRDLDDLLDVWNNKQGISFTFTTEPDKDEPFDEHTADLIQARQKLWYELTKNLSYAAKEAYKIVKKQSDSFDDTLPQDDIDVGGGQKIPTSTSDTTQVINDTEGTRQSRLPKDALDKLTERLIQKYPNLDPEDIKKSIQMLDESLTRACILYVPSESKQLWSYTKVYDFFVAEINTSHEFYRRVLSKLRSTRQYGSLTAIELLISSLVIEENDFITNEEYKKIIEFYRQSVGAKLDLYMSNLPDIFDFVKSSPNQDDEDETM